MEGIYLRLFVHENRKHKGILLYEWILQCAKALNIQGGSAFRALAGYGRHGVLHETHFFELQDELPVMLVFVLSEEEKMALFHQLKEEKIDIFYIQSKVECGTLG